MIINCDFDFIFLIFYYFLVCLIHCLIQSVYSLFLHSFFLILFLDFFLSATTRRVALTGSPLQNNLEEYLCMVNWVKPRFLGTLEEFRKRFSDPIKQGESKCASTSDVKLMKRRAFILHKKLTPIIDRKDLSTLARDLKPKREFVVSIKMSEFQQFMYKKFLSKLSESETSKKVIIIEFVLTFHFAFSPFILLYYSSFFSFPLFIFNFCF